MWYGLTLIQNRFVLCDYVAILATRLTSGHDSSTWQICRYFCKTGEFSIWIKFLYFSDQKWCLKFKIFDVWI